MPRPGPRPYECVKKAWHSDKHLPIRGSLIQEIFRLVNEVHKETTKKKKEWQEKLPIVVLRAEEIMYSKATCEAEYVDLATLGDRLNEAVNTIIRRDDASNEDGKFLQPCIEAALQLGCIPRRSSRSQRYSNPGCYSTSPTTDHPSFPTYRESISNRTPNFPFVSQQSNFEAVTNKDNSSICVTSSKSINQKYTCRNSEVLCGQQSSLPSRSLQFLTMQPPSARNSYSVYPLHFGDSFQPQNYIFGTKTATTLKRHLFGNKIMGVGRNGINKRNSHETKCDLSLRLGQQDTSGSQEVGISGSISSHRNRLLSSPSGQNGSDVCFFPGMIAKEQLDASSLKKSQEISINIENFVRKRKAASSHSSENAKSDWQLKVPS